ncbi:hypothetical protein AZ78_4762 [Lysobacter capsici AZ78]|uniref:Secreted protein n=1 Tax=Lysobacter capsici AZ78 TaxID=1444315 RepID=A0A108UDI1_9GAMM|nr:hypothetical protein [Lysobacter capsici]KWS07201.1 hypothetical protein AZ78_4762 [Lysobacter capsici AZ78]
MSSRLAVLLALCCCSLASTLHAAPSVCFLTATQLHRDRFERVIACETDGPSSPSCEAAEDRELAGLASLRRNCPVPSLECQSALYQHYQYWPHRSAICHAAGSASDPACVAAVEHDEDLYYAVMGNCGYLSRPG